VALSEFLDQLRVLGLDIAATEPDRVAFPYVIDVGPRAGELIQLGFIVPADYSLSCPSGPHVSPRLYPNQSGGTHPTGGVHDSPFGPDWHYWSRPFKEWAHSTRDGRAYMAHIRHLFATL
jgi:hypothetical protein